TTPVADITDVVTQQRRVALRSVRWLRQVGYPKKKLKRQRKKIKNNFTSVEESLPTFPAEATVCSNLACEGEDRTAQLDAIKKGSRAIFKTARLVRRVAGRQLNGSSKKKLTRQFRKSKKLFRAG